MIMEEGKEKNNKRITHCLDFKKMSKKNSF